MLRSIYVLCRAMPAYYFHLHHQNRNDYSLEYRLFGKLENQNRFGQSNTSKIEIDNTTILNLSVQLEYIMMMDINQIENNYNKQMIVDLIEKNSLKIRPRCFSVNENKNINIDVVPNANPFNEGFVFDSGGQCAGNDNNPINNNLIPEFNEFEEVIEDILFESDNDEPVAKGVQTDITDSKFISQTEKFNYINISNRAIFQSSTFSVHNSNSLLTNAFQGFKKMKENAFNNKASSNEVKLMKTSDTSSSIVSNDSYELDFEEINNYFVINTHTPSINIDFVLYKLNILKSIFKKTNNKHKLKINMSKLSGVYITILKNKY